MPDPTPPTPPPSGLLTAAVNSIGQTIQAVNSATTAAGPNPASTTSYVYTTQTLAHRVTAIFDDGQGNKTRLVLPINPEDIQIIDPTRTSVVNTLAGAYQEVWGAGIATMILQGTTGWRELHNGAGDGPQNMLKLRKLHRDYQNATAENDPDTITLEIDLPPYSDADTSAPTLEPNVTVPQQSVSVSGSGSAGHPGAYYCSSDELRIMRNKQRPMIFSYYWSLTILQDLMFPAKSPVHRFATGAPGSGGGNQQGGGFGSGSNTGESHSPVDTGGSAVDPSAQSGFNLGGPIAPGSGPPDPNAGSAPVNAATTPSGNTPVRTPPGLPPLATNSYTVPRNETGADVVAALNYGPVTSALFYLVNTIDATTTVAEGTVLTLPPNTWLVNPPP